MALMTTLRRVTRGGIPGILDEGTGRWLPIIAGGSTDGGDDGGDDATVDHGGAGADDTDGEVRDGDDRDTDGDRDGDDDGDRKPQKTADDYRRELRRTDRRAKALAKERDELLAQLKQREDADKSEHERALEEARRQAREEALREAEQERRNDRLETAVIRLASRGVKVGDDTLRFDDPEDALVFIERAINRGDLDADEVFDDDGRVKTETVEEELADLLRRKPRLAADIENHRRQQVGDIDAGKGRGAGRSIEELSVEELFKRKAAA